ncbi:TPA: DUF2974 domain-containing protein [Streptococcus suis]
MPNLLDYIKNIQYDSFYDQAINKLDILALTELSYLPFDDLVPTEFDSSGIRIDKLFDAFNEKYNQKFPPFTMVTKSRLTLFELMASSKRYKYLKAFAYINDYQIDLQQQFAAVSYHLDRDTVLTCFRGTDDTIIGWKEDFHMTYMKEIPAQQAASRYLQDIMAAQHSDFYVSGHSKGGNLAIYATSQLPPALQQYILIVYAFDAPGLHKQYLTSDGYLGIEQKIVPIIPQNSIVGMMLETPEKAQIVSSRTIGLLQHISFSWEVDGCDFRTAPALTEESLQIDRTLKAWTASLTEEELQAFFDLFFGIFIQAGIERFSDFVINPLQKLQEIDRLRKEFSPQEAEMMDKLIRMLFDTRYQIWLEGWNNRLPKPDLNFPDWNELFTLPTINKNKS